MAPPDPSITRIDGPWRHLDVHANGIRFHVVEANPSDKSGGATEPATARPLVILRGYGGSDKPPRGYDGWTLAGDTAGLIRALGHSSATLVGHADGGLACWTTALLHSRLVRAIALISSPHPAALRRSALTRRDQSS